HADQLARTWREWFPHAKSESDSNTSIPSLENISDLESLELDDLIRILGPMGPDNNHEKQIERDFIKYTYELDVALAKYGFVICHEAWKRAVMDRNELYTEDHTGHVYHTVIRERGEEGQEEGQN
ncbi:hypothetical protein C0992_010208, partial [Termitomyces sp. T32_za158]